MVICEVCVDSVQGAQVAAEGGADRIELCSALELGGLTPSLGMLQEAARTVDLPIMAMVRLRPGDFVVDDTDVETMCADIRALREHGADGLVLGVLRPDGTLDRPALARLLEAADGALVTFHRAIDMCADPIALLDELIDAGVDRVLTSGARASVVDGVPGVRALLERARGRIVVMPGAGIEPDNVVDLVRATGAIEVHLSAGRYVAGPMEYHNPAIYMGTIENSDEFRRRITDPDLVAATVAALRTLDD